MMQFDEGLKAVGREVGKIRGTMHYSISRYADLDTILGKNWHLRGFNLAGDCCYPILETIRFYIRKRRPLVEYIPLSKTPNERNTQRIIGDQGYMFVFSFVRKDGLYDDLQSWSNNVTFTYIVSFPGFPHAQTKNSWVGAWKWG